MYCSNCGKKIADDAKYCPECGQQVVKVTVVRQTKEAIIYSPYNGTFSVFKVLGFIILIIAIIVLVIFAGIIPVKELLGITISLSIIGLIFCIIGKKSRRKGLAIAGTIIVSIFLAIEIFLLFLAFAPVE